MDKSQKNYILQDSSLLNSRKGETKVDQWLPGQVGQGAGIEHKGKQVNFQKDVNIPYHDYSGDYTSIYIYGNSSDSTVKMDRFQYIQMMLARKKKKKDSIFSLCETELSPLVCTITLQSRPWEIGIFFDLLMKLKMIQLDPCILQTTTINFSEEESDIQKGSMTHVTQILTLRALSFLINLTFVDITSLDCPRNLRTRQVIYLLSLIQMRRYEEDL